MDLSLIVPYRNRPEQLRSLLNWFPETITRSCASIELILVESSLEPSLNETQLPSHITYFYEYGDGLFNKSKMLNQGLRLATGEFITSLDVDMFPFNLSFKKHLMLARESENLLITGYRMMTSWHSFSVKDLVNVQGTAKVAIENLHEGWLLDQLVNKHRFGHVPLFLKKYLDNLNGWDEQYVGWGAEDQDMIHRYLGSNRFLMTSPDLIYLHLEHENSEDWNNPELTKKNREYIYKKLNLPPNIR